MFLQHYNFKVSYMHFQIVNTLHAYYKLGFKILKKALQQTT